MCSPPNFEAFNLPLLIFCQMMTPLGSGSDICLFMLSPPKSKASSKFQNCVIVKFSIELGFCISSKWLLFIIYIYRNSGKVIFFLLSSLKIQFFNFKVCIDDITIFYSNYINFEVDHSSSPILSIDELKWIILYVRESSLLFNKITLLP